MKKALYLIPLLCGLTIFKNAFGQLESRIPTYTIIKEKQDIPLYDSLTNWNENLNNLNEFRKFIGQEVYLAPHLSKNTPSRSKNYSFLVLTKPIKVPTTKEIKVRKDRTYHWFTGAPIDYYQIIDTIITYTYKPIHFYTSDHETHPSIGVASNLMEASDRFYTILDVIYGDRLEEIKDDYQRTIPNKLRDQAKPNEIVDDLWFYNVPGDNNVWFKLLDGDTKQTFYTTTRVGFIVKGYMEKQKKLFENTDLIYTGNFQQKGNDLRYVVKRMDANGRESSHYNEILIEEQSRWKCVGVSLERAGNTIYENWPHYGLYYTLENQHGDQIMRHDMSYFVPLESYLSEEMAKTNAQLRAQQAASSEKLQEEAQKQQDYQDRLSKYTRAYGEKTGRLIADKKVEIGMTQKMCEESWGKPTYRDRTTVQEGIFEVWHYGFIRELHFANGKLIKVVE